MFFNNTRLQSFGKFNRCLDEEFQIFQNVDLKHQLVAYLSGLAPNHFIVFRIKNAAVIIETINPVSSVYYLIGLRQKMMIINWIEKNTGSLEQKQFLGLDWLKLQQLLLLLLFFFLSFLISRTWQAIWKKQVAAELEVAGDNKSRKLGSRFES